MFKKFLVITMALIMVFTMIPVVALGGTSTAVTVSTEQDLLDAIDAIPTGGSGVITISGTHMVLSSCISINFKDITFNLENSQLVANGDYPVIVGYGSNIVINADDDSYLESSGHTGCMGVVRIDNDGDYNLETQSYEKEYKLKINGGRYYCSQEPDYDEENDVNVFDGVFFAVPGTSIELTDVFCGGKVEAINYEGTGILKYGDLLINSGVFSNDVENYVAEGKYFGKFEERYYVRDKEYSDKFDSVLEDGKLIVNSVKPEGTNESMMLDDSIIYNVIEGFNKKYFEYGFYIEYSYFNDDFSKVKIEFDPNTPHEEYHEVDIVWNYDNEISNLAKDYISKLPSAGETIEVKDLELISYYLNVSQNDDLEEDSLPNYSSEFRDSLDSTNFSFYYRVGAGGDDPFCTERLGDAYFSHDGVVYYAASFVETKANHILYVPDDTGDSKDALISALQKRIDDYFGKNIITVSINDLSVDAYKDAQIQEYRDNITRFENSKSYYQALLTAEQNKPANEQDSQLIGEYMMEIMLCNSNITQYNDYIFYFEESFEDGGYLEFMNDAVGGHIFNLDFNNQRMVAVVMKDSSKMVTPTYKNVDLVTKVEISTEDGAVPLDAMIQAEKLTSGAEYDKVMKALDIEKGEMYDLGLYSNTLGKNVTKLENGMFEVKIPLSDDFKDKENLVVLYADDNDKVTTHEVTKTEDGYAVFLTNHFSIYTLTEAPADGTTTPPTTGDANAALLWAGAALVAVGGITVARKRKEQ